MEVLHGLARYGEVGGVISVKHVKLLAHYVSAQSYCPRTVVVEHVAVYLVLVYSFCQQLAYDEVYLRIVRVVCESSSVGHHAAIDACRAFGRHLAEVSALVHYAEHEFACAAHLRTRDGEHGVHHRIHVVVYHYFLCRRVSQRLLHLVDAPEGVEVQAEYEVGAAHERLGSFFVLVVAYYFLRVG